MTSLNILIPGPLAEFAARQAAEEGYPSTDAYIHALIRAEGRRPQAGRGPATGGLGLGRADPGG